MSAATRVLLLCLAVTAAMGANAESSDESAQSTTAEIDAARNYTEAERKAVVSRNLDLGRDEAAAFWPIYRDFRQAMVKIHDDRVQIIDDYAEHYRSMTPAKAKSLLDDYLQSDEALIKTKRQYLGKFRKVLPDTKVARFYQIENKMDAFVAAIVALQIPLLQTTQ
jgi:Skp family chaperone for outer membrane proteins